MKSCIEGMILNSLNEFSPVVEFNIFLTMPLKEKVLHFYASISKQVVIILLNHKKLSTKVKVLFKYFASVKPLHYTM
jgi:hypothetical protein